MAENSLFRRNHVHDLIMLLALAGASHATFSSLSIGGLLFGFGLFVSVWSKLVLIRNSELITRGPYAICRHPFYLGNAIMDVGMCVMSGYFWVLILFPVLFHVGYRRTFAYEEALVSGLFPGSHRQFSRTTPLVLPLGRRMFSEWRTSLNWSNFFREHIASRSLRHLAYPVLIVLASRLWAVPGAVFSPVNVGLLAVVFSTRLVSSFFYSEFEASGRPRRMAFGALLLHTHSILAWALLVFLVALVWEGGKLNGLVEAIPWGAGMLFAGIGLRGICRRWPGLGTRLATLAGLGVLGVGLLVFFDSSHLLPVVLALLLCRVVLPVMPVMPARGSGLSPRLVASLATVGLILSVSAIAVEICLDDHVLDKLASHLELTARQDDLVVVLKDGNLSPLKSRTRVDLVVAEADLDLLLVQRARAGERTLVIVDLYDVNKLPTNLSSEAVASWVIGMGTDMYLVLII